MKKINKNKVEHISRIVYNKFIRTVLGHNGISYGALIWKKRTDYFIKGGIPWN